MLKKNYKLLLLAAAGLAAGFVNGFLGTGGGIILVFALGICGIDQRDRFATVIAVILPLSAISAFFYRAPVSSAAKWLLPGMLGGAFGALLLDRLDVKRLKSIFAAMVIWAGICFLK